MSALKEIKVKGNKPPGLKISRDKNGVIHIDAKDINDVMWGSGYAHGKDRYTQLLLMRIIGQGRLCELLEDSEENLAIDSFFRRANWYANLAQEVTKLSADALTQCQHYCDGINAGFARKKYSVLRILGYSHTAWTIEDSILISRMAGYLTLAQSQTEIELFFIECIQAGINIDLLAELFPIEPTAVDLELLQKISLENTIIPKTLLWSNAIPRMMASNNWVINGSKTKSGQPLLANDPHLEVNRLPNVWCEQSLRCGEKYLKGMGMPGLPGIVIGRNNSLSWGVTYSFMDTVDSWVEKCHQGQYELNGLLRKFNCRKEVIKRKSSADIELKFYDNDHGVLAGDPHIDGYYLATRWSGAQSGAASLEAGLKMFDITSASEAMSVLGGVESSWNWVLADTNDNIAYQMSGLMPKRPNDWNGFLPMPGWTNDYDWQGMISPTELPRSFNPKTGFIVTANQDLNAMGNVSPINMPMGNYRANRITNVIEQDNQHTAQMSKSLQLDVHSLQAEEFLAILLPLLEQHQSTGYHYETLKRWNCDYELNALGAPVFESFYQALREQVFGSAFNGFGHDVTEHLTQETGIFIDFYQQFDRVMLNPNSTWYNDITQSNAFLNAFKSMAPVQPNTQWQEVNTISFSNILTGEKIPSFTGVCSAPIALRGGRATPNQGQIYRNDGRQTSFSATIRMVCDMNESDILTSLAGGPSDNPASKWYRNELNAWRKGEYKRV